MVPLTLGSMHAGWWQHFGKAGFSHMPQKGIDIKKGCDLSEVRANTYSSKDPRFHFCALTVQQTHQGCIWLQCQLRVFLVCTSESKLCSPLASALHWDNSVNWDLPEAKTALGNLSSYCLFSFSCFPSVAQLGPSFLQKHLHVSVESHTTGHCIFQASCILLHSLQASPGSDCAWKGKDPAQDCRPVCQQANHWTQWVPAFGTRAGETNQKELSTSCLWGSCPEVPLKVHAAFAVARHLQAEQPGEHRRSNGQAHMLGTDMQQCQISPSGSSKDSLQDGSGKISNEPSEWASASFQLRFLYKH